MKILVTGGQGFIGYNLIKYLIKRGHEIHSIDNLSTGSSDNIVDGCNYIRGDIVYNIELMDKDFDVVYHLAALSRIQPSFKNPYETFENNTDGTFKVAEFCRKIGCKLIYAGSSSRWHDPTRSPYALAKHMGEEILMMYKKVYKLDIHIARFYNVYGPREIKYGDWAAVIGKWRGLVEKGKPITVVGDGKQKRDFTHVDDIVDGLHRLLIFDTPDDKYIWEFGRGKSFEILEVAKMFRDKFGCEIEFIGAQKGNYRSTLRENDDALKILNWIPIYNLTDYIKML